ncbi:MAG: hypothetical protein ACLQSX_12180 [Smithella sp.]
MLEIAVGHPEQGMEAAVGQSRHRWVGEAMAVICSEQPPINNP